MNTIIDTFKKKNTDQHEMLHHKEHPVHYVDQNISDYG